MDERENLVRTNTSATRLINTARNPPLEDRTEPNELLMSSGYEVRNRHNIYEQSYVSYQNKGICEQYDSTVLSNEKKEELKGGRDSFPPRYSGIQEPQREDYSHSRFPRFRFAIASAYHMTRAFLSLIFDFWSLFILLISILSAILCVEFGIRSNMPTTLLSIGIFFPISFTINFANSRRERALLDIADFKANIIGLYQFHRDWSPPQHNYGEDFRQVIMKLVDDIADYLHHRTGREQLLSIYRGFDAISKLEEQLRKNGDPGAISRAYQYQRQMMFNFESMRTIHDYRTPASIRSYALIFLAIYPILFGPLFAEVALGYGTWAGIYVALISSVMFIGLHRVAAGIEDPWDCSGVDDLNAYMLSETD